MQILFDSKKRKHKSPFGCLYEGEVCTLAVEIPDTARCKGARLIVENDEGRVLDCRLYPERVSSPYSTYKTAFTLPKVGLYFYYFFIETPSGGFSLFKMGNGTNMEAGERWQISCIPADFHTPRELWGAVFYQIFPDRFYKDALTGEKEKKTPSYGDADSFFEAALKRSYDDDDDEEDDK